jgi:hypothetical protein
MVGVTARRSRSLAERAATEAFVHVMRRWRVREHAMATEAWVDAPGTTVARRRDLTPRYRMAPPFWPLTVNTDEPVLTGFAVNAHAVVIRYAQRDVPLGSGPDGFTSPRTDLGAGCHDVFLRASGTVPAFVCEALTPDEAMLVVEAHLIDAMRSLIDGRGPVVTTGSALPPRAQRRHSNWNAEAHGERVHQDHQRGATGTVRL